MYLQYAGIRVTNVERSLAFYTQGLGLTEIRRGTMDHGGQWVLLEDPRSHQTLELNWYPKGSPYDVAFTPGEGLDHLGVRVSNLADAEQKLTAAGGKKVHELREDGEVVLSYLEDPDGIWIELILTPEA